MREFLPIRGERGPPRPADPGTGRDREIVRAYHVMTRHDLFRYAYGPHELDWATQPDPYRRYRGAELVHLEHSTDAGPPFGILRGERGPDPAPLNVQSIARLFEDAFGLAAWKESGDSTWALRVNPSSGNLHPTESYLVGHAIEGIAPAAGRAGDGAQGVASIVAHYAPREHALEIRGALPTSAWRVLAGARDENDCADVFFVGLTSIHWREAWKYGERAFRYCQLDLGHALACVAIAARGLGWRATLADDLGHADLARLLCVEDARGAEPEEPECAVAVHARPAPWNPSLQALDLSRVASLADRPNALSSGHVEWDAIDVVASATRKARTESVYAGEKRLDPVARASTAESDARPLRQLVRQRRSAVAFDRTSTMSREHFFGLLQFTAGELALELPWRPRVHIGLFVHRVRDLDPGVYLLVRDPVQEPLLRSAMEKPFGWERPAGCPRDLSFFRLQLGDCRRAAQQVSCHQAIAADGAFSAAMLTEFEPSLERYGAFFYRRLFWECGWIGQLLYVAAEAIGWRATGIGCFFDEPVHALFGLGTMRYRSLYHFSVGMPVEDRRLTIWPGYPPRDGA